ncbi:hypothetical protein PLICRDRAFT_338964 [Plicaturopsis crispa FD-325 SS-3]|uniref:F-box domain-containing protein n=1 Tax=Plicaturopsis crispa FD-325 SS-3 TaxID=944288 RepID=A0A0C9T7J3_PLICR|nr:hypothetical protein PLICRDRAFT_338964 [Plicaturopsis crispa FD-325 SS-3]
MQAARMKSPVASMPTEILGDIFDIAFRSSSEARSRVAFRAAISQVSRRWRDVSFSLASLWSFIAPSISRTHILRSKNHPLDIFLDTTVGCDSSHWWHINVSLDSVLPYVSRWREFHAETVDAYAMCAITTRLAYLSAPLLERLTLRVKRYWEADGPFPPAILFKRGAPRLESIRLHNISLRASLVPSVTHLELRFTHFGDDALTVMDFFSFLSSMRSVVDLTLDGSIVETENYVWSFPHVVKTLHFPYLQRLIARSAYTESWCAWLVGAVHAPALLFLAVHIFNSDEDDYDFPPVLRAFSVFASAPRYPSLRSLTLDGVRIVPDPATPTSVLRDFMRALPSLTTLCLACSDHGRVALWTTLLAPAAEPLWPRLQRLCLLGGPRYTDYEPIGPPDDDGTRECDVLANVLQHRAAAGMEPLRALHLDPSVLQHITRASSPEHRDHDESEAVVHDACLDADERTAVYADRRVDVLRSHVAVVLEPDAPARYDLKCRACALFWTAGRVACMFEGVGLEGSTGKEYCPGDAMPYSCACTPGG